MEFDYPERHPFGLGIPTEEFAARRLRLQAYLGATGAPGASVWGSSSEPADLAYLANHFPPPGESAWLHVPNEGEAVLYADRHRPDLVMVDSVRPLAQRPRAFGIAVPGELAAMREIKSAAELALLADAATVAAIGLEAGLATVLPGATERHVAAAAVAAALGAGADECRCSVLAGRWAGPLSRWPDASDEPLVSAEPVVIELWGARQGYRFREAVTIRVGERAPLAELDRALAEILPQLRPGTSFRTACAMAARALAEESGPAGGLGWGIGLGPAELPFVSRRAKGRLLKDQVLVVNLALEAGALRRVVAIGPTGGRQLGSFR